MSAIAALCIRHGSPDAGSVSEMLAACPHRGREQFVEVMGSVALGVARDPEWIRASLFRGNRFLVALAGRLDNASDLRTMLALPTGSESGNADDAFIVAAAFDRWGPSGVAGFRGSFSGLVTDGASIWAFRDQFGSRPLFFHAKGDRFVAATEVKQVLVGAQIPREPDLDHLHGVLLGGFQASTAFVGVSRVPQRSVAHVGPQGVHVTTAQYWDPSARVASARIAFEEAIEGTREALNVAVSRVLTGQDAILLSGGLDSPSLAAFAAKSPQHGKAIQAVTAVYPDFPSVDESEWTRMVADHLGLNLHEFVAKSGSLDDLDFWTQRLDGPVDVMSIPEQAEAYGVARGLGARTVLTGELAEIVFESRSYLLDDLFIRGRIGAAFASMGGARRVSRRYRWFAKELIRIFAPPSWMVAHYRRHPRPFKGVPPWIDQKYLRRPVGFVDIDELPARERWRRMQVSWMLGPGLMFEADEICAASCGVESRRPFADVDLFEYVLSLPGEVKFPVPRSKPLLRAAMRGMLPDALIDRKDKTVFDAFSEAKADYETLGRLVLAPGYRFEGIDYSLLASRLESKTMPAWELQWARTLARIHAFLNQW